MIVHEYILLFTELLMYKNNRGDQKLLFLFELHVVLIVVAFKVLDHLRFLMII